MAKSKRRRRRRAGSMRALATRGRARGRKRSRSRKGAGMRRTSIGQYAVSSAVSTAAGFTYPVLLKAVEKLVKNRFFAGLLLTLTSGVAAAMGLKKFGPAIALATGNGMNGAFGADMCVYFDVPSKVGIADYFADYFADPIHPARIGANPGQGRLVLGLGAEQSRAELGDIGRGRHRMTHRRSYSLNDGGTGYGAGYGT